MSLPTNNISPDFDLLLTQLNQKTEQTKLGGGQKRLQALKDKGKMTARERIEALKDPESPVLEIGLFAADGMYEADGGCPSAGVVVVVARVAGRLCVVVANDASVKAGAWFPMSAKKNLRAQEFAAQNRLPVIYLVDSAGVYLPLQADVFADKDDFGRLFRNNARLSAMGVFQIAAIMGSCVAGGAYLPIMSDESLIVEDTGSVFLAGAYLVKSAIGETTDNESLGGATTHCEISGVTDHKMPNDAACLAKIRSIMGTLGQNPTAGFSRIEAQNPLIPSTEIYKRLPTDRNKPYNMLSIIECLVDNSEFEQYKELYGKTILCGYARIDGWAVGIMANQRIMVKSKKGEAQMGGVIYSDSADKAARFVMNCNQKKIPLLFLQDVSGFMVGSRAEHGGIIKDGAKLVSAVSNSVVPKFTILIGNSYGAGNYAMCGRAYDPRFMIAWPTARLAVMSGAAAANTLLQIRVASLKSQGKTIDNQEEKELLDQITQSYETQLSPYYAASQLWTDAIIDPADTRTWVSVGIEAANHAPIRRGFNPGIIQT